MSTPRRWLLAAIAITAVGTAAATVRDGAVASRWTDALGLLLGGLAGTEIGERLERFGKRFEATWIAWLQMAAIAFLFVGVVTWQALPAYCQLPVAFAMGAAIVAAIVYIQRLRMRLG
jgi:hypothetical protein